MGRADRPRTCGSHRGLADAHSDERAAALTDLRKVVLTDKDTLRVSAGQARAEPHYEAHAGRLANLIGELLQIQNGARLACDIAAGLRAGQAFADAYARAKRAAGVADFDDLIRWTRELLAQPGMGRMGPLQARPAHRPCAGRRSPGHERRRNGIIVWNSSKNISRALRKATGACRTLFMVGDFKQAIYGFQGTRPEEFDRMRNLAPRSVPRSCAPRTKSALEFRDLLINASYRSAQPVLDTVDAVIRDLGFGAMKLPRTPAATCRAPFGPPRPRWSCGSRSPWRR